MATDKKLDLIIQPKIIDHLGIKMYQKPVDVISEFIANTWDCDSEVVEITIKDDSIIIQDFGIGMTFDQCQKYFLTVGRDRRKDMRNEYSEEKKRPILGRKGIGKFAGFGIAQKIQIKTISKINGERTEFLLDIAKILELDYANKNEKPISVLDYQEPSVEQISRHGTTVSLFGIKTKPIKLNEFKEELSRRFLISQFYSDFRITVNGEDLPENFSSDLEFVFPRDLTAEEKLKIPNLEIIDANGWAVEKFLGKRIVWRIGFFEDPIEIEELRGISIFAKNKLAQKPFFFDLTGGISGQHGLEYMTGQVKMDFIDEGDNDLIATERQRINLQTELGQQIKLWGIDKIKLLSSIWKKNRGEKRHKELEDKLLGFKERLDSLPPSERKTVKSVLLKIATFERLGKARFFEWCNALLTSWETGRLRELISELSEINDFDENKMLEVLAEADILTALNIAESVKTKIVTIGELKQRVEAKQLENKVRDYIYTHPWIIHPKWESFKKERSVEKLINDIGSKHLNTPAFDGRVDLALSSGSSLLLIEFIRPGVEIDLDHLDRINVYVLEIRNSLTKETGKVIKKLENAYLIADTKKDSELISSRIAQLEKDGIFILTWNSLIEEALKQWGDFLVILKERNPNDKRIQVL